MATAQSTRVSSNAPFRHAFERYEQPLIRYAMRIVRDQERARDIVQDTFLRMCESDVDADDPRLGSWLYTVCRNRAIDVKRRDGRVSSMDVPPEIYVEPSGEHQRAVSEVFAEASSLPEKKTRVLELRYREGRSYQQIADQTGLSVSHVGVLLHDCIKYLRKNMSAVAGLALLVGAGMWGVQSSRRPAPPASYFTHDQPVLPMVVTGELPPEDFYGPEPFYGPELPEAKASNASKNPNAARPRMAPSMPMPMPNRSFSPPRAAPPAKPRMKRKGELHSPFDAQSL